MKLIHFIAFLALTVLLAGCSFTLAADITPPPGIQRMPTEPQAQMETPAGPLYPIVQPNPLQGESIYLEKCQPCHGTDGLGDGPQANQLPNPVPPIGTADIARQATPAEWYRIVTQGNLERFMPPFQSLSDRQRWDVVAYVFSLSTSAERRDQGQELYQANCESCHGPQGKGDGSLAATFTMPDFSDQANMASLSLDGFYQVISNGASAGMPAFSEDFSEDQRWILAEYVRSLTFVAPSEQAQAQETTEGLEATPEVMETGETEITQSETLTSTEVVSVTTGLGTITGLVMNASGGDLPSGVEVDLFGFDQVQVVMSDTTTINEGGSFLFENVEKTPDLVFVATVDYQGVTYGSDIASFEGETQVINLPSEVYESSSDTSILQIDRIHLFFEFINQDAMRVVELYIVSNPGNETIAAEQEGQPVLTYSLPEGATNLQFEDGIMGGRYVSTAEGFGDTIPIRPGSGNYQILFSYEMNYDRSLDLVRPVDLNTGAVVILVPENGIKIKGDNIEDAGIREVQGISYHMYNGSSLAAGQELHLTISGRPSQAGPALSSSSSTTLFVGLGAFGIVLIAAGIWLYRRSSVLGDEVDDNLLPADEPEMQNSETVMDAILALDDLYQEGELPEDAYLERRAELKARLQELMDE